MKQSDNQSPWLLLCHENTAKGLVKHTEYSYNVTYIHKPSHFLAFLTEKGLSTANSKTQ